MTSTAYLGVDIGTSSTKGVLVDADGVILRTAVRQHEVVRPATGQVEMSGWVWWQEFTEIATELTGDEAYVIAAVGVSGMGPCALLADGAGEPLRPAILYGVDTRASVEIEELNAELGRENILATGGSVLSSQAVGPKLAWVRKHEPELWRRAAHLFMPASWLAFQLTGAYVLDHHSASQCTPLYDSAALTWHSDWAELIAPGLALPELRWPGDIAGHTTTTLAGIRAGTPVITGTIDAWSEALSVDAQHPNDLMVMYGTTMFLIATTTQFLTSSTMWSTIGAFPGLRNLAGGMATSGAITQWLTELTGADYPTLLAQAHESGRGARGLLALPYFAGERTPIFDPDARGVIAGLTLDHSRGDLYRAVLEATGFGVRHNIEAMTDAGAQVQRIIAVGGGLQGELWSQIISDITGLDQVIPTVSIGASYGAAALAAMTQQPVDVAQWNPPARTVHPDPTAHAYYTELYRHYRDLYPATRELSHVLAAHQAQTLEGVEQ